MIPFTRDHDATDDAGLRDYRVPLTEERPRRSLAWLIVLIAFALGFLLGRTVSAAEPCVTLQVRPRFLLSRGDVRVEAHVRRHGDHRAASVSWTSADGGEGRHVWQLDGEDAAVLEGFWIRDMVPTHYLFLAAVYGAGGKVLGRDQAEIITAGESR